MVGDEIQEELDEWLYMLKHAEVREDFQSPYMQQVADRLAVLNPGASVRACASVSLFDEHNIYQAFVPVIVLGAAVKPGFFLVYKSCCYRVGMDVG